MLSRLLRGASEGQARPLGELLASGLAARAKLKPSPAQVKSEMWLLECTASSTSSSVRAGAFSRLSVLLPRALKKRGREGEHDPERLASLAVELLPSSQAAGDDLVFSLLKYGLVPDTEFALNLLVPLLGDKRGRILDLARHHSKFKEAMGRTRGLRLLLACLEGVEEIEDGAELLSVIMSNHGGGLTTSDCLMREVMKVMSEKFSVELPLSDIIKGGGAAFGPWGGFVSQVDTRRIWATLGRFPTGDMIGKRSDEEGDDQDTRYSPAFIIPMAVACAEDFLPPAPPVTEDEEEQRVWTSRVETFTSLTRRFCDIGIVGLALCSLSSKDPLVRKLSWCLLSMMYKGVSSRSAEKVQGWSSRPQLSLVLESVLKGIKERQDRAGGGGGGGVGEGEEKRDEDPFYVGVLPCVTGLFLARAFDVMDKQPHSPLYGPLNAYFLSNSLNTFTDLNALPAFASLFCSGGPTARQSRAWALKLLVDGCATAHDYQVSEVKHRN